MIYADNAATTRMSRAAIQKMTEVMEGSFGNPSSLYAIGREAKVILEQARDQVASVIHAQPGEILFTSGGTEADNQAVLSAADLGREAGKMHIVSSAFEHHAVLHSLQKLQREGFDVTLLDVHEDGIIRPAELESAIREDTCLVTIMTANNEIGTIQPVREIGRICRRRSVLFHTDAVQAVGHISVDVTADQIDLLSASAHKFHGPKGVGFLYARKGIRLSGLKEDFRKDTVRTERYSAYADRLVEEHLKGAADFSLFDPEDPIFDAASGTQQLIRGFGRMRNTLLQ